MERIRIITTAGVVDFQGEYLPELEKTNWHYYRDEQDQIQHFRKEHMVAVIVGSIPAHYTAD